MYELVVIEDLKGLEAIRNDWEKIHSTQENKHFYESYGWFYSYTKNLKTEKTVFFCVKVESKIVAIIPLQYYVSSYYFFKVNFLQAFDNEHFMFNGIIFASSCNKREIVTVFLKLLSSTEYKKWHVLKWSKLIGFSSLLLDENYQSIRMIHAEGKKYQIKKIRSDISDEKIIPKSLYKSIRRYRNRISRAGEFRLKINLVNEKNLVCFKRFLDLEASGWKGEAGSKSAIKLSTNLLNFYLSLITNLPDSSNVYIFELLLNEESIASAYTIIDGETAYGCKIGYNEKHSNLAPGKLLDYYLLIHLKNELDIKELNFTSDANWQREWGVTINTITDIIVYKNNFIAYVHYSFTKAKLFLKKIIRAANTKRSR